LENAGICLHPIHGFVYLPGTGLKGLARAYAERVWLETQPQTERVAAWQKIEAVFGWAPAPDSEKFWKPVGLPMRAEGEAAAAGSVVFHDAWPEKWPELTVDIVNNHHPLYYRGEDAPGDWDSPNPVYFLAVKPGAAFTFALAKRRFDVSDALVKLAQRWLDGALTELGCGAKTAAGYGYFSGEATAAPPTRKTFSATLELVSPAFLAGADQQAGDCGLRPATLRGLLRWWWRTLHAGFVAQARLREMEAVVWGDTQVGGAVRLRLAPQNQIHVRRYDKEATLSMDNEQKKSAYGIPGRSPQMTTQGLWYMSFGMDNNVNETTGQGTQRVRRQRHFIEPGALWSVWFDAQGRGPYPAEQLLRQAVAALWLLCHYGGVGSKARKGFGSCSLNNQLEGWSRERCLSEAAGFRVAFGETGFFDPDRADPAALSQLLGPVEHDFPWPGVWHVLDQMGFAYQSFAQKHAHQREKKALGLPRKIGDPVSGSFHSGPNLRKVEEEARKKGKAQEVRHASPVWIHLDRCDIGYRVRVAAFPATNLPDPNSSRSFLDRFLRHVDAELKRRSSLPLPDGLRGSQDGGASPPGPGGTTTPKTATKVAAQVTSSPRPLLRGETRIGNLRHNVFWVAYFPDANTQGRINNVNDVPADIDDGTQAEFLIEHIAAHGAFVRFVRLVAE
jgi:CRISPR-associated protein Cmr6